MGVSCAESWWPLRGRMPCALPQWASLGMDVKGIFSTLLVANSRPCCEQWYCSHSAETETDSVLQPLQLVYLQFSNEWHHQECAGSFKALVLHQATQKPGSKNRNATAVKLSCLLCFVQVYGTSNIEPPRNSPNVPTGRQILSWFWHGQWRDRKGNGANNEG